MEFLSEMDVANHNGELGWNWDTTYLHLPEIFYEQRNPEPVSAGSVVIFNESYAKELGIHLCEKAAQDYANIFVGNEIPKGAKPIAQAYAGHQFGHFNRLGDGRAVLIGEHLSPDGKRVDIQLKGSGRTRYSRGGDGRAALGPMLREYLMSEAMAGLGIPTTRSLAVSLTGEKVYRSDVLPGAILVRVAASHIRVGTFQWAAALQDEGALQALQQYTAARHYPNIDPTDARAFFYAVMEQQLKLVVNWMRVGFVHGVLNTDNVALSGETIDYGPCAFLDRYKNDTVFSSIDRDGRYAFGNQASITRWNLARLAEAMLPLFDRERGMAVDFANEALGGVEARYQELWLEMMRAKLGLLTEEEGDLALIQDLLEIMEKNGADYTNTFWALSQEFACDKSPLAEHSLTDWHLCWCRRWMRQTTSRQEMIQKMMETNPAVIPRNHKVEEALSAANAGDIDPFLKMLEVVKNPYKAASRLDFMEPASSNLPRYVTYCGT